MFKKMKPSQKYPFIFFIAVWSLCQMTLGKEAAYTLGGQVNSLTQENAESQTTIHTLLFAHNNMQLRDNGCSIVLIPKTRSIPNSLQSYCEFYCVS